MFGRKTAQKWLEKGWKKEIMSEIIYTLRLARNAPFAHLGAPRGCQSVVLYVHMAKTRHYRRIFGRKTAQKRPKNGPYHDRIQISATQTGNYVCLKL